MYLLFSQSGRIYWNISSEVNTATQASSPDLHLVQMGLKSLSKHSTTKPEHQNIFGAVVCGVATFGTNCATRIAIETYRNHYAKSPIPAVGGASCILRPMTNTLKDVLGTYAIRNLNHAIYDTLPEQLWPRLDKHPLCTPVLAQRVRHDLRLLTSF